MESREIVDRWAVERSGQLLLWEDHDQLIRTTPFKAVDPDFDRQVLIHFWMNVYKGDAWNVEEKVEYEIWKTYHDPLYSMFLYVKPEGYMRESCQSCLQIAGYKKEPLEDHMKELLMWLPHYKCVTNSENDRKAQYFSIFEHTLSEGGIYNAWVYSPTECEIGFTRYGHYSVKHRFDSLEKMLDYIRLNYWYEKRHR